MASAISTIPALQVPIATRVVTVTSGNLFDVSARYLGDAQQWTRIARLNGLGPDPWFTGLLVLRLPAVDPNAGTGGVLNV